MEDNIRFGGLVYKLETVVGVGAPGASRGPFLLFSPVLLLHELDILQNKLLLERCKRPEGFDKLLFRRA